MPDELDKLPLEALDAIRNEQPRADRVASIAEQLQRSLQAVGAFPSRRVVVAFSFLIFAAFTLIATMPFGYGGFRSFDLVQRIADYGVVALIGLLLAMTLDQEIVPGSKMRMAPSTVILGSLAALCVVTRLMFPQAAMRDFVARGVPCLRLGLIVSAVGGVIGWWFSRKGYATSPARAGAVVGSFAGLAGVAVLALHCSIQNASHVLLWHLGAYVIAGIAGLLIGFRQRAVQAKAHP